MVVISMRYDRPKTEAYLRECGIRYTELVLVESFAAKSQVIQERNVAFFIDDQPEVLQHIPEQVGVLLFRNGGNYDYEERKWLFSNETAKIIC